MQNVPCMRRRFGRDIVNALPKLRVKRSQPPQSRLCPLVRTRECSLLPAAQNRVNVKYCTQELVLDTYPVNGNSSSKQCVHDLLRDPVRILVAVLEDQYELKRAQNFHLFVPHIRCTMREVAVM